MALVLYTLGVLFFAFAIVASIALHELGHLVAAKSFGTKVTQYFVGFGPKVWSKRVGETEYGVKAIPLGGYVKIIGMLPPAAAEEEVTTAHGERALKVRQSNTGMFTQLISDARAAEWELVEPGDEDRLFYRLTWWRKIVVMAAGPTVNLVIAFLIFGGIFATYGNPRDLHFDTEINSVVGCVVPYSEDNRPCTDADPISPARAAGLRAGDRIVSFNGTPVDDYDELQALIRANSDGTATISYVRDGVTETTTTNTTVTARPTSTEDETLVQVGFLGITPTYHLGTGGPLYTVREMGSLAVLTGKAMVHLPVKVWDVALAIAGVKERDPQGPVSVVGGGRIAGETASAPAFPLQEKLLSLLMLVAGFNFFIGLFNFVPLLPLDGGHIVGALYEAVRRGWARIRGRPDPGYVDVARLLPIAYGVGALLLVMGVVLIIGDLVAPIRLSG